MSVELLFAISFLLADSLLIDLILGEIIMGYGLCIDLCKISRPTKNSIFFKERLELILLYSLSFGHIFGHILNFKNIPAKLVSILVIKISP